jgi:hypothetical protein
LAAVGLGFVGWLTAAAYPLYRGGNFLFHSNIAEEIWKGRFWIYYLPFPGSMLSRQAQWGNILVPHPCLEQTLLAPLAALPQPWFHFSEKAVVSLWLAGMAWVAARLAATAGQRAATLAAVVAATLVPGYQLLGLGHLMTVLGCLGGTLALAFLALRLPRLAEAPVAWALVGFLTFAFLSYFAALLFSGLALGLVLALLARAEPRLARRLLWATAGGATLAFLLYYIHWALPFLAQSVPRILGGSAARPSESATPILSRLLLQPGKLGYSYGSAWIPLVGLAGLSLLPRGSTRMVVACWAAVLPVVSGLDVFFNFLLKHHYFVMVPVASGCGLVLARIAEHGRLGRATALLLVLLLAVLGLDTAYAVAVGQIP